GERKYGAALARAAVAFRVDALFMEMHEDPDPTLPDGRPLSGGPNMLRIDDLPRLLRSSAPSRRRSTRERRTDARRAEDRRARVPTGGRGDPRPDPQARRALRARGGASPRLQRAGHRDRHGQIGTARTRDSGRNRSDWGP